MSDGERMAAIQHWMTAVWFWEKNLISRHLRIWKLKQKLMALQKGRRQRRKKQRLSNHSCMEWAVRRMETSQHTLEKSNVAIYCCFRWIQRCLLYSYIIPVAYRNENGNVNVRQRVLVQQKNLGHFSQLSHLSDLYLLKCTFRYWLIGKQICCDDDAIGRTALAVDNAMDIPRQTGRHSDNTSAVRSHKSTRILRQHMDQWKMYAALKGTVIMCLIAWKALYRRNILERYGNGIALRYWSESITAKYFRAWKRMNAYGVSL